MFTYYGGRKKWKIKNWHRFSIFILELKIKWANDPRTNTRIMRGPVRALSTKSFQCHLRVVRGWPWQEVATKKARYLDALQLYY